MSNATFDFDSSNNLGIEASLLGDDSQPFGLEGASRAQVLPPAAIPQATAAPIVGTSGDDRLRGTGKADTIDGAAGNDILLGRNGKDRLLGQRGRDRAKGGNGNDTLEGGGGSDRLLGNDGNDGLVGAGGKDKLRGGLGDDAVTSGRGRDRILLAPNEGTDTITDFTPGKDQIKLLKKLTFADLTIAASGRRDSSISITRTGEVLAILKGIRPNQLSAADFGEQPQAVLNAQDDTLKVREGGTATELSKGVTSLLDNDQGELLTLDSKPVSKPEHGTVEMLPDGRFTYRHDGSETTSDSFRYRVVDGEGNADTATVRITVNPFNDAPVGVEETAVVAKGGTTTLLDSGATTVLANDVDPEKASLTAELVEAPLQASNFQLNTDGSFTYTHNGSQNLSDRFTYQANDGNKKSGIITVNITVTPSSGNAPVAVDDQIVVKEGGTVTQLVSGNLRVTGNDTDPDLPGDVLKVSIVPVTSPTHGALQLKSDGTFSYTHDGSENLSDSFVYEVKDSSGQSDTATVFITIDPVNEQAVLSTNTKLTVTEGDRGTIDATKLKVTDVDSGAAALVYTVTGAPTHGKLELTTKPGVAVTSFTQADIDANRVIYIHNNSNTTSDRFTFEVSDGGKDGTKPVSGAFSIDVTPVIDLPVAVADAVSVDQGGEATLLVSGASTVLANDTLGEADTLTAVLVNQPQYGSLTLNDDGTFSYTHDGSENFEDSFTYQVSDGTNLSAPVEVAIAITPFNKAPVNTVPGKQTISPNTSLLFSQGNDNLIQVSDPDAGATPVQVRLRISAGTLTLSGIAGLTFVTGDGTRDSEIVVRGSIDSINAALDGLSYVPPRGFIGTALLSVTTNDLGNTGSGGALLDSDTVEIIVGTASDINDPPVNTVPGNQTTLQGTNLIFQASGGNAIQISDPDAGTNPVQVQLSITSGTLSLSKLTGLTFLQGDGVNDSLLSFTGTIADINAALNGLTYTPNNTFSGTATLTLRTSDQGNTGLGSALVDEDQVAITVTRTNQSPIAQNDAIATDEDTPINIAVLGNDSDSDGSLDVTSVAIATDPTNGTVTVNPDTGVVTYTPNKDFNGADTFTYTVTDNEGLTSQPATVTITVNPVNDKPVAVADVITTDEDTAIDIPVLDNDTDIDGKATLDPTSVAIAQDPTNGTLTVDPDTGIVTYTPDKDFNGTDSFTYTVADAEGLISEPVIVTITVTPVNDQPIAVADAITIDEDTAVDIPVLANDTDPDGNNSIDPTTVVITQDPANGTFTVDPDTGVVTYTPNKDFNGTDSFTYTVADTDGLVSEPVTVTITINPVNDKPVAVADSITTDEDTAVDIPVLANDTDPDGSTTIDPTTVVITQDPTNGTLTIDPDTGVVTYTPDSGFSGADSFTYTVADADGFVSDPATVTITVNSVIGQPDAVDDSITTDEDTAIDIPVLANDTDPDGNTTIDSKTVTIVDQPKNGTFTVSDTGIVTYTPDKDFNGTDSFTYTVADADGLVSDPATVTITVNPVNDKPVAVNDSITTDEDTAIDISVLDNDTDIDGDITIDPKTVTVVDQPKNGTFIVSDTGVVTYTPDKDFNGTDSFTYTVADADGLVSDPVTVTITVNPVNDLPIAKNDKAQTNPGQPVVINVVGNDSDLDGTIDPTSVSAGTAQNGTVDVDPVTGAITYTPDAGFGGVDSFTYTVKDNEGGLSNVATVTIQVGGIPVAVNDTIATDEDTAVNISVLGNDTDPEGNGTIDPTSVTIVEQPKNGTFTISNTGVVTYIPNQDFNGTDSFTYTIADLDGFVSDPATVTITVDPVNDAPVLQTDKTVTLLEDAASKTLDITAPTDIDGDTLTITVTGLPNPAKGSVYLADGTTLVTNGQTLSTEELTTLIFKPVADANGNGGTFSYQVTDGTETLSQTITFAITPQNDAPLLQADKTVTLLEDAVSQALDITAPTDIDGDTLTITVTGLPNPAKGSVYLADGTTLVTNGQTLSTEELTTLIFKPVADANGNGGTFSYQVTDGTETVSQTITFAITPQNDAPLLQADKTVTLLEDTVSQALDITAPTDIDGDTLTITVTGLPNPAKGSVYLADGTTLVTNGQTLSTAQLTGLIFKPIADANGNGGTFSYQVTDGTETLSQTITFAITPQNDAPLLQADKTVTLLEDAPSQALDITAPVDGEGDTLTITVTGLPNPAKGSVYLADGTTLVTNGQTLSTEELTTLIFKPVADANGNGGTFSYQVTDGTETVSQTITFAITPQNDIPIAKNDTFATSLDVTLNGNLLANNGNGIDTDPDGDTLTVVQINGSNFTVGSPITLPSGATLTVNANGTFTYLYNGTIPAGSTEADSFTYTISDGQGGTATATANLTISGSNNSPIANDDDFETNEGTAINGNLFNNNSNGIDRDPDGDPFTVTAINGTAASVGQVVTLASGALLTVNDDGTFDYDPNGVFNNLAQGAIATDTFTYTITDSKGKSDVATVSIQITGLNDNPMGQNDTATTDEDTAVTIDVLANDTDPDSGDTRQISSINTTGTKGQIIITGDNRIFYDPRGRFDDLAAGQTATDTFTYNVIDSSGAISTATVTITIAGVNDAPVVRRDSVSTGIGQPVIINVLANDSDIDGTLDPGSIQISANPNPAKGTVTVNADGTITYTPTSSAATSDSFTYTVKDNNGLVSTSAATVDVFIVNLDGEPVANGDIVEINEGETVTIDLVGNDIDNGSINLNSIVIGSQPAHGTLVLNGDGTVTYTPNNPNFNGVDGFNYQVRDNQNNLSNVATVSLTIAPVNDAPINTLPSNVTATEDTPFAFTGVNQISVNDIDITNPDTSELTVTLSVTSGSLTLGAASGISFPNGGDGINDASITLKGSLNALNTALSGLTYNPVANFSGDVTLIMTTSDRINDTQGSFGSGGPKATTDTLVITVQPGNDDPDARNDSFTTNEDTSLDGDVLQNNGSGRDRDPDGDSISVLSINGQAADLNQPITLPSGATLILNGDGTFTYNPSGTFDNLAVGQQGTDTFEYTVSDGNGGTETATVTITINGRNDAPVIGTNTGTTVKKGNNVILTNSVLQEADPDSDGANVTYVVSTAPADGRLALANDLTTAITEFTQADIDANRVVYVHTADSEAPDSFEFSLRDQGGLTSAPGTFTINISTLNVAPVLDLDANDSSGAAGQNYGGRFNQGGGRVAIADGDLSITDSDDSTLVSMTVTLTNRPDDEAEILTLTDAAEAIAASAGIATAYNSATGELTLTGKASISQYEEILKGVRYNNNTLADASDRTITVTINDGFDAGTATATSILAINLAPVVGDDTYAGGSAAVGNTRFTVGTRIGGTSTPEMVVSGSILANDSDASGGLAVTAVTNGTTTTGGRFTLNADGTFTYLPKVGFTGMDTFTYTVTDQFGASATGTVSITVDDLVWYVNSSATAGGSGYYDSAFRTLSEAQVAAGAGAYIYVYGGNNTVNGFTLENNQSLIGAGADLTVSNGRTVLAATGTANVFNNSGDAIILGQNNTIRGLTIGAGGFAIRDAGANVGTLTMDNVTLQGSFRTQAGGTLNVNLNGLLGSQLILKGMDGSFTATNVSLTAENLNPVLLENNTANISLQTVDIRATDAVAINSINGGNLTISTGQVRFLDFSGLNSNGIQISQTAGTATVALTGLTIRDFGFGETGQGIFAQTSGSGTLNLNLFGNTITTIGPTDIQVVQGGTSIFALKDFAGNGTIATQVQTYLSARNSNVTVVAIPGTNGFTSF